MDVNQETPELRVVRPRGGLSDAEAGNVKQTAQEQVELDRLLPHEDVATTVRQDAELWADVYQELLEFKQAMIALIDESMDSLTPLARGEVGRDRVILSAEADRLALRHTYWRRRVDELHAASNGGRSGRRT